MAMDKTEAYLRVLTSTARDRLVQMEFGSGMSYSQLNDDQKAHLAIIVRNYAASGDSLSMQEALQMFTDPVSYMGVAASFNDKLARICSSKLVYNMQVNRFDLRNSANYNGTALENSLINNNIITQSSAVMDDGSSFFTLDGTTAEGDQPDQDGIGSDRKKAAGQSIQKIATENGLTGFNEKAHLIAGSVISPELSGSYDSTGGSAYYDEAFLRQNSALIVQSISTLNSVSAGDNSTLNDPVQPDSANLFVNSSLHRDF